MEILELKRARIIAKLKSYKLSRIIISLAVIFSIVLLQQLFVQNLRAQVTEKEKNQLSKILTKTEKTLHTIEQEDQYKKNKALEEEIKNIQKTYKNAVISYEDVLFVQGTKSDEKLLTLFAKSLAQLSERQYASAEATLALLNGEISKLKVKVSSNTTITSQNVPSNNAPPSSGYSRQQVQSDVGIFLVDIVSADLGSTRVIVDTASESDCQNDCPVLSLGDYVSRSGGFAGVNGSYFCPASYPSCSGKTNSFDTLLLNKNKHYFNSDNNMYSVVPAAIFLGSSVRYVSQSLEWGRDTGIDGVIANQPLLLVGGNIVFGGSGDPKQGSNGSRSFVGSKGSTVYIGVIHNVTVAAMAHVLKALGLEGALNLDSGGSTALWSGGYKVGPGRNIPNAVIFVRK